MNEIDLSAVSYWYSYIVGVIWLFCGAVVVTMFDVTSVQHADRYTAAVSVVL